MKSTGIKKRLLSIFLAVITVVGVLAPGLSAFAAEDGSGGVIGFYDVEIFYEDGTLVPSYQEDGETEYIEYMYEGDKKQFTYQFIDCTLPDNGYVKWSSDTPTVCDVTEDGLVRAFDSSKGAAVRLWIDNEVATIPLIGSLLKTIFEKALFNDTINVDTMDTDAIIAVVEAAFGSDSLLDKYIDSYKGELIDSLREYLDKVNTTISCTMYDAQGNVLDTDSFKVCVQKSQEIYADFIPNGTHITNKQNLPTTVAVGSTVQISACTTPTRLHMGVIYSVKNSSIFSSGKVIATVDDSGLVTFKNTGEVTIVVSPDTDGFIENLLKYINYIYELNDLTTIDSSQIADILIKYVGLDINRTVLTAILDACFAISDIVGDTADPVKLTATAVKVIANIILQFTTNDSITFTVVDGVPLTDFEIGGATTVREGSDIQLSIENAKPEAADTSDITWTSSDPSIASVDPVTGIITGRDAGGSLGSYSQQTVEITATSAANNISKTVTITVTGRTGKYLSDVEIVAERDSINIDEQQYLYANVYPSRVADANNLYITWGIKTKNAETGEDEYLWAAQPYQETDENGDPLVDDNGNPVMNDGAVSDGIGKIDANGLYTAVGGGSCTVVCKAQTGYYIGSDNFYEISSVTDEKSFDNGQPIKNIALEVTGTTNGSQLTVTDAEVNGEYIKYAVVKIAAGDANITYVNKGIKLKANIDPENATNKNITWYIDNDNFTLANQDNTNGTVDVKLKAGNERAQTVNIYCVSEDGSVKSDTVTLTVARNYASSNTIDGGEELSLTNGKTMDVTHSMSFEGSLTGENSACYDANWYSSDEDVLEIVGKDSSSGNAVVKGVDVGTATLYCVSADGGIVDTATVTVYPDKERLRDIIGLCEKTVILKTDENASYYKDYMRKLNYAYYIDEEMLMASQSAVDTYADELLYVFYQLGGYVGLNSISVLNHAGEEAADYISVPVDTLYYYNTSYQLDYELNPAGAMYSDIKWTSSNDSVSVDSTGKCTPTETYSACYATITVTATDYFGDTVSDSVVVAFARTQATGITVDPTEITGKTGESQQIDATVQPTVLGITSADIDDVIWSSSNEDVAAVDGDGNVTFVYGGDCVITATTADGGYTAECAVHVVTNYDALQQLVTTYKNLSLEEENYYPDTYKAYIEKLDAAQQMIDANASTQEEVDNMYKELEAAYNGLKKYTFIQKVELYLDGEATSDYYQYDLSLLSEGLSYKNAQLNLNVRLYPNNASYASVEWTSSTELINVTQDGTASPAQDSSCYGMITCTVTDHFGNQWSDDVWVSFAYYPVTSVSLSESEIAGNVGDQRQLNCVIYPTGDPVFHIGQASIKDVYWESDDETVATVDQNGLVTFTGAGATTIRVTSYDGGFSAQCSVSTSGDRAALNAALSKYAGVNYMDYQYDYGMAFKNAYETAQAAIGDNSLTQSEIDEITLNLNQAGEALTGHEFVAASVIHLAYDNQKQNLLWQYGSKGSGSIADDAATHTYNSSDGTGYKAKTIISASLPAEAAANYTDISWSVADKSGSTDVNISGSTVEVEQGSATASAKAQLLVTATDTYGRTVTRTIRVVVSDDTVSGITLDQTNVDRYANAGAFKLNAQVTPDDAAIKDVVWTSSDESVATVDANGNVTPVNTGSVVITAETFDGGYKASCNVTLRTDYTVLANTYAQYNEFYQNTKDTHTYTNASLEALRQMLELANNVINESTAKQADVDLMLQQLIDAYNGLVLFVPVSAVSIELDENSAASVVNEGFIRYESASLNGVSIQLNAAFEPADCTGVTVEWSSSNGNIAVDSNGKVTKNGISPEYAVITAKATDEAGNVAESSVYVSFVRIPVASVSFDDEYVYGSPSTTVTLNPNVSGSSVLSVPSVRDCVFTTSDPEIATVDENGTVTFIAGGECIITAYSADGGHSATIRAITTNDTTALNAAIEEYSSVNYMDYEYDYGMAFKSAYENAVAVSEDYLSTQDAIDSALAVLQTAYNNLDEHPFIGAGTLSLQINGQEVKDGESYVKDSNNSVVITASYAQGAMIKSAELAYSDAQNVTAEVNGNVLTVVKDNDADYGSITVTYTVTDDYDRVTTVTRNIMVTDSVKMIESFKFVYNGEEVDSVEYKELNLYGKTIQLSINTYPEAAESYTSISWSSSNSKITVDENGVVAIAGLITASNYSATITCTLTLSNGSTVTNSIPVTFRVGV